MYIAYHEPGHVSIPDNSVNNMVRANPVKHIMPVSMNPGNGSCRTNNPMKHILPGKISGNTNHQFGQGNIAAPGHGNGANTLVATNTEINFDPNQRFSKAKNSQGIPVTKERQHKLFG